MSYHALLWPLMVGRNELRPYNTAFTSYQYDRRGTREAGHLSYPRLRAHAMRPYDIRSGMQHRPISVGGLFSHLPTI